MSDSDAAVGRTREEESMARILVLTRASDSPLAALELLGHTVHSAAPDASSLVSAPASDVTVIDARDDLPAAKATCRLLAQTSRARRLLVVNEGGLAAINAEWSVGALVLSTAGPAEVDARVRMLLQRTGD